ncbi:BMP family ABC transporter substrate-binding protein [Streptomyces sp. DSM 44915]|uniref:BMP family ABC transporter substrate-binding protein n=1 Tax=Streptomyces chisholmiae TaxID=3075540 RepID=A0ABU2JJX4_9ACTN|nr:BMP family ABC transporter substrate-binding protein [Streptomyces sp. DSM 44915]MDT0265291.1 BMP family ABC transporter substrate-binding protein [Streptomyces sp. DSM 44915]
MRRVSRFAATVALAATLALTASACGESSTESNDNEGDKGPGIAFDVGGRDDHSFNEAAAVGADRAGEALGITPEYQTARNNETNADRVQRLTSMANEGFNPVIGVGYLYDAAIREVAPEFPDTTFGVVDAAPEGDNIYGMVFAEHEVSYLAGVAAALKSETGRVGFIGGVDNPLIQKFEAGFVQGVTETNPDIEVEVDYLYADDDRGFNDPARASEKANAMLGRDVDVIYTAAGSSGTGAIEQVAGVEGAWAIGVDSDQYQQPGLAEYQDSILTSGVKRVDVAVEDLITAVHNGEAPSGVHEYTLAEEGVELSTSGGFIDDIQAEIDAAAERIVGGEITVNDTP